MYGREICPLPAVISRGIGHPRVDQADAAREPAGTLQPPKMAAGEPDPTLDLFYGNYSQVLWRRHRIGDLLSGSGADSLPNPIFDFVF
jgi:hypothetical protein